MTEKSGWYPLKKKKKNKMEDKSDRQFQELGSKIDHQNEFFGF